MTSTEIKAAIYDQLVIIENAQKMVQALNAQLINSTPPGKAE